MDYFFNGKYDPRVVNIITVDFSIFDLLLLESFEWIFDDCFSFEEIKFTNSKRSKLNSFQGVFLDDLN